MFIVIIVHHLCMFNPQYSAATRKLVDQYEQQLQHFMTGTTVSQFKKLLSASATPYKLSAEKVPVKLTLPNLWGVNILHDVCHLIISFGVPLHLFNVVHGGGSGVQQVFTKEELMLEHHPKPAAGD